MKILALCIAGVPHRWLDIDRAAYYVASGKVAWDLGDAPVILRGGFQRASGRRSELLLPPVIGSRLILGHWEISREVREGEQTAEKATGLLLGARACDGNSLLDWRWSSE